VERNIHKLQTGLAQAETDMKKASDMMMDQEKRRLETIIKQEKNGFINK